LQEVIRLQHSRPLLHAVRKTDFFPLIPYFQALLRHQLQGIEMILSYPYAEFAGTAFQLRLWVQCCFVVVLATLACTSSHAEWSTNTANYNPLCTAPGRQQMQYSDDLAADYSGGTIFASVT
jgi:hypothetical protein